MKRRLWCVAIGILAFRTGLADTIPAPVAPPIDPAPGTATPFVLLPLPYPQDALEPYISARTMSFHYGQHHKGYVDKLNKLVAGTELAAVPLEEVIRMTTRIQSGAAVFNTAAQAWNHAFFWKSMRTGGGGKPPALLLARIEETFGSLDQFRTAFIEAATGLFGSGWVWLVEEDNVLKIVTTSNADTPVAHNQKALLCCDVWEHAYYLDYQNRRKDFVEAFLDHLVDWESAAARLP